MFHKILIANRGEIACRIIKTAKKLAIKTVAIHSDADQDALFVKMADEAYRIGAAQSQESYLNIEKIIAVAKNAKVDAIHPGYGFLAENATFAKRCAEENIIFIGPSAKAIDAMGSKAKAKTIMEQAGVPLTPGYHGDNQEPSFLLNQAEKIGFPVLIKATAGGGGKGMRIVNNAKEFNDALASCQREAKASFDNPDVLLEKYLEQPRHVEIQICADNHGNYVHLFERDCSIQRRHQKIIEEARAPNIPGKTREAMAKAAIDAAKTINYTNCGTVEFLLDKKNQYYFMEMNTRLQVEHPITELITNIDLVEWQLRIAAGEKLPLTQDKITAYGHAIEARVCAEDPDNQFMPATGSVTYLRETSTDKHVRIDSGIVEGDVITPFYDPMIAKIIAWGESREQAIERLHQALSDYHLAGIKNNIPYLKAILQQADFIKGNLSTHFLQDHEIDKLDITHINRLLIAATLYLFYCEHNKKVSPWQTFQYFRVNIPFERIFYFSDSLNHIHPVKVILAENILKLEIDKHSMTCESVLLENNHLIAEVNNEKFDVDIALVNEEIYIFAKIYSGMLTVHQPGQIGHEVEQIAGHLTAPMPGAITTIKVSAGQKVSAGDPIIILEAMKMEHTINAPFAGTVVELHFDVGAMVNEGDELIVLEPAE